MTDDELNAIADTRKEVDAAIRKLKRSEIWLEFNSKTESEYRKIRLARKSLQRASHSLYEKEHGIEQGATSDQP